MLAAAWAGVALIATGLVVMLHHGCAHAQEPPDSAARRESCPLVCYFQPSDVRNHETWALVLASNGCTLLAAALAMQ